MYVSCFFLAQCLHQGRTFVTFDKNEYQFVPRGKCDHTLLRICDKRRNNITVTMRKVDGTLKRAVTVLVDSKKIEVLPRRRMGLKPIIKVRNPLGAVWNCLFKVTRIFENLEKDRDLEGKFNVKANIVKFLSSRDL